MPGSSLGSSNVCTAPGAATQQLQTPSLGLPPATCSLQPEGGGNHKGMALVSSSVGVFGGILQSKGNKKSIVINLAHTFCPKGDRRVQLLLNS